MFFTLAERATASTWARLRRRSVPGSQCVSTGPASSGLLRDSFARQARVHPLTSSSHPFLRDNRCQGRCGSDNVRRREHTTLICARTEGNASRTRRRQRRAGRRRRSWSWTLPCDDTLFIASKPASSLRGALLTTVLSIAVAIYLVNVRVTHAGGRAGACGARVFATGTLVDQLPDHSRTQTFHDDGAI